MVEMSPAIFTARKGKVFHRGVYLAEPSRMLAVLLDSAERKDWFAPSAAEMATELQDAISVAEAYHNHIEERSAARWGQ